MVRPAGVPEQRPAPPAESPTPHGRDIEDLTWTDVADVLWLASATAPPPVPTPEAPEPHEQPPPPVPRPEPEPPRYDSTDVPVPAPPPPPAPEPVAPETAAEPAGRAPRPELRLLPGDGVAPAAIALPRSLDFFRALRTLKRDIPSRRDGDVVLDEEATAEQAAETGLWWPVTKSRMERWLDLTLVVDNSPSMSLWHSRVAAFVALLEQLGAFRSIHVRLLDTERSADGPRPVLRGGTPGAPARDPAEVLDSSGRRAVLLLTDGIGEVCRPEVLHPVLSRWGRRMAVTVVNLLPRWLWGQGGLDPHRARMNVGGALKPNARWTFTLSDTSLAFEPIAPPGAVPVPVIELRPRWLSWWARLVAGEHRGAVDGAVLLATDRPRAARREPADEALSPRERVQRFRSVASPPALRLATLLAALPARLDVAEVIARRFVPEAGSEHLGELVASGLVVYAPELREKGSTWDTGGTLEFPQAVRELLLSGARRSETASVVRVAAAHFGERIPVLGHLRDAIADPHNTPDPERTPDSADDVVLEGVVMRALSGPYLSRADRIRHAEPRDPSVIPASESITKPIKSRPDPTASEPMRETTTERVDRSQDLVPVRHSDTDAEQATRPLVHPSVSGRTFPERQPDDPPPVWGNVPPRNPNFTGRDELLEQLEKRLNAGGTTAVLPSALHGMGGIGKTHMATEYIYRHLQDYDVIWWIDAAQTAQIRAGLTELARMLGLPAETNVAIPAVLEALRTGRPFRRWLLVFDAADSPSAVLPYFPRNGPGEILITSRNADWAGVARPLELAVFKREESIELLGRRGPEIPTEDADALADKLGDLPLAIEQAAAWRAVTGMPVHEYLRLFDESVAEILDTASAPDYEVSVAAAWNVSFDELRTRNPAAHQILHICAFFSPEPISRDLFTGVSRVVSISPELDAALRDPIKLARAIRDINRYGLAKIDHGNNTIQLHRLVQLVLRNRVMAPQMHAQMQHGAHQLLAALDPNDPESSRSWPRYRELLPHAIAANVMNCDESWPRQLVINLMRFLSEWRDHEEAAKLALAAHEHFTRTLGPTDPQTMDVSARLGRYLAAVGRYSEAAELNQRTLALRLQVSGEENEEVFALQRNIVFDLRVQGDFAAATKLSEEIYFKSRRMFGDDDPETLHAAYQHGISLRLSGEYRAAAELDQETYRRQTEVLGPDQPRTFNTRAACVVDIREAGEYGQARVMQEKHAEQFRIRYGDDHPDAVTHAFLLAISRRKDGDHKGALALSGNALASFRRAYGEGHATTMACALAHSIDLRHAGELGAARELGEQTFERYRRNFGEHHPHTLGVSVDLGVTLRQQGDVEAARELDERALEHFRAGIGPDHPYAIVASINLASDLSLLGNLEKAIELGTDAVDRSGRVLGGDHPTTLAAAFNLGLALDAAGRQDDARPYREPVISKYRTVLGEAHPGTQAAGRGVRAECDIDPMLM
ncbi:tetratricopeptide repeat protein [Actinophytocola sp. S1-96]|uniref:Tetratricopeptide repeat protein n=1 Tax=Actinophytocola gossypii TaxID=2812003 RepID=A0ABT2J8W4_9PSEU|nr:tetratricopeptide repeat protein [Actinophytocola gossypii]